VRATIGVMLGAISGDSFAGGIRINDELGLPRTVRISNGDGTDVIIEVTGAGDRRDDAPLGSTPALESFIERAAELADQAVWVVEPRGRTLMVNEPMARLVGSTTEQLGKRSLTDAVADIDRRWVIGLFDPTRPDRREPIDVRFRGPDGTTIWTTVRIDPLRDEHGSTVALVAFVTNMADRREEQTQTDNERRFRLSFEDAPLGRAVVALDGSILEANRALGHILGLEPADLVGQNYRDLEPTLTAAAEAALAEQAMTGQVDGYSLERRFVHSAGNLVTASLNVSAARNENDQPVHLVIQVEDITARNAADLASQEAIARFQAAFVHAPIGMAIVDLDGSVREANPALCRMLGSDAAQVAAGSLSRWAQEDDAGPLTEGLDELRRNRSGSLRLQLQVVSATGTTLWTQLSVAVVGSEEEGRPPYAIAQLEDITERRLAEHDLVHQTLHDPLTGLGNRLLLKDQLNQALGIVNDLPFAVLFLDLDKFKSVNDTHGHDAGDVLLIEVGERLRRMVRGADTVARLGGDEFAVVARGINDLDHARAFAAKVQLALRSAFRVGPTEISVSASIGMVLGSPEYESGEHLLRDADVAMYRAKDRGRDRVEVFDDVVRLEEIERLETERTLRQALDDDGLVLHYQPVVDLRTGHVIGAEALLRLADPEQGLLEPKRFLAVAAQSQLILELGAWVLREVCSQLDRWRIAGFSHFTAWVNVSGLELASPRFHTLVQEVLEEFRTDPTCLRLELSESDLLEASPATISSLRLLTAKGIEVGIDDFGTGYSSLAHLRELPVSFLKIDSSFTRRLDEPGGSALVEAMVGLGRSLDLDVIAEGVESRRQVETLAVLGCGRAQGHVFAAPVAVAAGPPLRHEDDAASL